jgi:glycine cleavage system H protein
MFTPLNGRNGVSEAYLQASVDKFIFKVRLGYLYTQEGVWVAMDEARGRVRAGLTDFRQQSSGDMAFVDLPPVGHPVKAGEDLAGVETVKVDLAIPAPCDGEVTAVNDALAEMPELINQDPYGEGWLVELEPASWPVEGLLDAEAYLSVMVKQAEEEAAT